MPCYSAAEPAMVPLMLQVPGWQCIARNLGSSFPAVEHTIFPMVWNPRSMIKMKDNDLT
jgi:hypothetical protein